MRPDSAKSKNWFLRCYSLSPIFAYRTGSRPFIQITIILKEKRKDEIPNRNTELRSDN